MMNKKGFTILEVLVAILIIAFGLLALMRALSGGLTGSKRGHDVTIATILAQEKMEETRYSTWPPSDGNGTFGSPNDNFDWEIATVATVTPTTYLREVSLSIYWPAAAGSSSDRSKQRCLGIKTYLANYSA